MKILLMGAPASGKGTISVMLSEHFSLPLVNVGGMLRSLPKEGPYQEVHEIMASGEMVPNHIVGALLREKTRGSLYENGYILDGWLRQFTDLEFFDPQVNLVLLLNISKKTSEDRIYNRRVCKAKGHTYDLMIKKPKIEGICDLDGSPLISREDDREEALETRWKIYFERTLPVIEYFKTKGILEEISAEIPILEVFENAKEIVAKRMTS